MSHLYAFALLLSPFEYLNINFYGQGRGLRALGICENPLDKGKFNGSLWFYQTEFNYMKHGGSNGD